jgi:GNAT superfamily N-acetyltransferase
MNLLEPIKTPRLQLIPLTLDQLRAMNSVSPGSPNETGWRHSVSPSNPIETGYRAEKPGLGIPPGMRLASGVLSEAALRAIAVKVVKMRDLPAAMHLWFTYWLLAFPEERLGIGMAGFKGAPNARGEAEIGYGIAPAYQNRGYMTEAVQALVGWAFEQPRCQAVVAQTLKSNLPSRRVLMKAGFTPQRYTDKEIFWKISRMV